MFARNFQIEVDKTLKRATIILELKGLFCFGVGIKRQLLN